MASYDIDDIQRRMDGAFAALKHEFSGLRTGRANAAMLDNVTVDAYGAATPLNQVGNVNVPEPRMLSVSVWDKSLVAAVEKAIRNADLGVNPIVDGQNIRIPVPPLNEERRIEMTKLAGRFAENARVAVRNVRRDGMESLKAMEKDSEIGEDDHKRMSNDVQSATDAEIAKIDAALATKEEEIMQV
ncbi:Ribosome recycling factor [hydrothermal vent metagenome]|uniref:Ribosome recycling factor n=1 Tax=hydrothermal vent metagenome TaxID=652676 RepID=A0A3B0SEX5_9ZZZZ